MSTENTYAAALQGQSPDRRPTAASRQGLRHVGAYVPPDVARQLRVFAAQEDTSTQALMVEAIEMLFRARQGGQVGAGAAALLSDARVGPA